MSADNMKQKWQPIMNAELEKMSCIEIFWEFTIRMK